MLNLKKSLHILAQNENRSHRNAGRLFEITIKVRDIQIEFAATKHNVVEMYVDISETWVDAIEITIDVQEMIVDMITTQLDCIEMPVDVVEMTSNPFHRFLRID